MEAKPEQTRRSSRNTTTKRYDTDLGSDGDDFDVDDEGVKKRGRPRKNSVGTPATGGVPPIGPPGSSGKPRLDTGDKKRGRPSKEILWDENYTGPLRRCAYVGHEELWGPDVPVDLQPQYFYSTTARCIYCYKHLCNERHANKTRDKASGGTTKKKGRGRRSADDDDDDDDEDDEVVRRGSRSSTRARRSSGNGEEEWQGSRSATRVGPVGPGAGRGGGQAAALAPNILQTADGVLKNFENGPRILQEWVAPPVGTLEFSLAALSEGAQPLQLKLSGAPSAVSLAPASHSAHGPQAVLINATPKASCVGWVSSDTLVISGGATLQVWTGLQTLQNPHLAYALVLEGGPVNFFIVLPRSAVPKVRFAAVAAVHSDGRVRLHSLPIPSTDDSHPLLFRQLGASPVTAPTPGVMVHSIAVSTHPSHPNRIILGHSDGSLRWVDLPPNPGPELPAAHGSGGAGFSIASAGYLPTSDAAFWAVGESASVAIGDIREPFGGPAQPGGNSESFLKTADSSVVYPALIAGGDGGHIWALPWAGEQTPPPRLLCSLNGAALSIRCHPFLPIALTGCSSGAARALWLPLLPGSPKNAHQLVVHATGLEDRAIVVDAPNDVNDNGFRNAGPLACGSVAWAPDLDGRYAVAHVGGLVRVGTVREFVLRSATK